MSAPQSSLRGPLLMIIATAVFTCSDSVLKIAAGGLPPFQVLAQRGFAAVAFCFLIVVATGNLKALRKGFSPNVLRRNVFEMAGSLTYITALANMPIADVMAIAQTAPMLLVLGAVVFFGDRPGFARLGLVAVGCVGALLVAQPNGSSGQFALLAFIATACSAMRDLIGRKVPVDVPSPVVVFVSSMLITLGAVVVHFLLETTVLPDTGQLAMTTGGAMLLSLGQICLFLAYRHGSPTTVAPFYYCFSIWSVLAGLLVFGTFPNAAGLAGICMVVLAGVATIIVATRERQRSLGK